MKIDGLTHPKTKELAYTLGIPLPHAIGLLELTWAFVAQQTPEGNIGKWSNAVIAGEAGWHEEADVFVNALISCGFLDEDDDHRLLIHDWADHAPNWVHAKLKKKGRTILSSDIRKDLSEDLRGHYKPSLAKPSQDKPNTMGDSPSASPPRSKSDLAEKEFEQLWAQYPRRAGSNPKRDALKAYRATRKRGSQFEDIEAGLRRYIRFCEATGKVGTETVMQAKTFFGPSDRWSEEWLLPKRGAADKPKLDPKGARPGESWDDYEKRMIREQARA